ncbi:MAG: M23 family metallopeptidase [Patescibacteria group bacterium]
MALRHIYTSCLLLALFLPTASVRAADDVRDIFFPTDISIDFTDNYGDARSGHLHEGVDILGPKMTPLYAAVDGKVARINDPEESWGYEIVLRDADDYTYHYIHVNNDTPGTDDGLGGIAHAYAPGIVRGASVTKGQLVGWMGDSGNAETVTSHLHFEIRKPDDTAIDPYASLVAARYPGSYSATDAMAASSDINTDKGFVSDGSVAPCVSGSLIKISTLSALYYCGADGKRHAFPSDRIYFTWYADFKTVKTISAEDLAAVPLGKNVTYRPGSKMVKIESIPNVYAIEKGGVLRWIKTPEIAASIYGSTWSKKVDDISDAFFLDYTVGTDIAVKR